MPAVRNPYKKYLRIKDRSIDDRPREKLESNGKATLTKAELLAIILGSGIQHMNAVDLARQILKEHGNDLSAIAKLSIKELTKFQGIGKAKAALIVSAMELANRLQPDTKKGRPIIKQSEDAYQLIQPKFNSKVVEEFWLILVNNSNEVIKVHQISRGGLSRTIVDSRIVFKQCILYNAIGFILVHNHPSGNTDPSATDIELTTQMKQASKTLELKILDHLIIGRKSYFSFADQGML